MIDRNAYREMLHILTDDELLRIGVSVYRDCVRSPRWDASPWHEWSDVTAELKCRGPELMPRLERMYRAEQHQPRETMREFLNRAAERDAARKP